MAATTKTRKSTRDKKAPEKSAKEKEAPVKVSHYVAVKKQQWHPFQKIAIPVAPPGVMLNLDSWLRCQIKAHIVKEV